jgi:RNA polymerase sigma-70 factor (ECF subfamily)
MPEQLSDAILLERFVSFREEAAFGVLVERHGPLVQRICRRVLRNEHDVDDVFQATFLVLARRASGIVWRESVAGWLGAVAHRLALGTRSDLSRQLRRETAMTALADGRLSVRASLEAGLPAEFHWRADPSGELQRKETRRLLNDELLLLPEKYRSPVVLCYLEGRTHEEAARELGCPAGSMSRRLNRAHAILRRRLILRGFSFAIVFFTAAAAVVSSWVVTSNQGRSAASVRTAMASLKSLSDAEGGLETAIARISRDETGRERELVAALAGRATQAAEDIEGYEPGDRREQWREYVSDMKRSAALLAQAASENDRSSMLIAARRLGASCLGCHQAFIGSARESAPGIGSLFRQAGISHEHVRKGCFSWFIFEEKGSAAASEFRLQRTGAIEVALLTP